jgi:hypothetical protein
MVRLFVNRAAPEGGFNGGGVVTDCAHSFGGRGLSVTFLFEASRRAAGPGALKSLWMPLGEPPPGVEFSSCFFLITLSCLFPGIFAPGGNCYTSLTALRAAFFRRSPPAENSRFFRAPGPAARPGPGRSRRRTAGPGGFPQTRVWAPPRARRRMPRLLKQPRRGGLIAANAAGGDSPQIDKRGERRTPQGPD